MAGIRTLVAAATLATSFGALAFTPPAETVALCLKAANRWLGHEFTSTRSVRGRAIGSLSAKIYVTAITNTSGVAYEHRLVCTIDAQGGVERVAAQPRERVPAGAEPARNDTQVTKLAN